MTLPPGDWARLKDVFAAARTLPEGQRQTYIAEACQGNEALHLEVESLLLSDKRAKSFLEAPAVLGIQDATATRGLEGQRIGPYDLEARIGAGGMGEVYRAHDTQLNRQVAIKVLLPAMADDSDRLARFNREAQVLASFNHPHIAQIYGLEDVPATGSGHARTLALVMELVEGPTLADRIACAAFPLNEALAIARQIAEALESAHAQGIVHRDLKPANIKVRGDGTVKVLDFGLATTLAASTDAEGEDPCTIVGTAAYMSPEQARGRPVDMRADIWAFGCVLYEMLTRRRVFDGETPTDAIAAAVTNQPDWTMLPADTPEAIRTLLRRCLEKDCTHRIDSAAEARLAIDDALMSPAGEARLDGAAAQSRRISPVAMATLASVALASAAVAWILARPAPQPSIQSSRFAIVTPPAQPMNVSSDDRDLALSPAGRHLVYRAGGSTTAGSPVFLRAIDQLDARPLAAITNAYAPFFSPDGQWIGFFENAELKKAPITRGPVVTLCAVQGGALGASWGDDNTIVFATDDPTTGLWRVSADGGEPTMLTRPDPAQRENDHGFPSVLPGSRGVLFTIAAMGQPGNAQVAVLDLATARWKTLVRGANQAEYIAPATGSAPGGYLIYAAAGSLRATRFDPTRLEVRSNPVTVVEQVMTKPSGAANYAVSRSGTLVYVPQGAVEPTPISSLVWVDRMGVEEPLDAPPEAYGPPRVSPDGTRVAVGFPDQGNTDIWIWDLARATRRRLTFTPGMDGLPFWTPDSRRIIFMSARSGVLNWYSLAADGTGAVERLTTSPNSQWPLSVTPDGSHVFGFELGPKLRRSVIVTRLTTPATSLVSLNAQAPSGNILFQGTFPEISRDGRYVAYTSDESGREEVYVRPFPQVDSGRWQVSTAGATRAAWAPNGRELFYLDASNTLTAVTVVTSGPVFSMGSPAKVFDNKYAEPNPARHYDISPDGRRFLMVKNSAVGDPNATPVSMVVVEHWFEELKARVR